MIHLTASEKAARYDSLQAAIAVTKKNWTIMRDDAEKRYRENAFPGNIGAYDKGLADGLSRALDYLERWSDK